MAARSRQPPAFGPASSPARPPSAYSERFYFDTISHHGPALAYLLRLAGPERLLFGTDVPFPMADEDMVRGIGELPDLSDEERRLIYGGNAAGVLGLSASVRTL